MSFIFEKRDNSIEFFRSPCINFKPHLHEHIELVYIVSGKCDLYVDDKYYSLKKGDISVVFPNQIHGYENSIDLDAYVLIFSSDILYEFKELCYNKIPSSPILKNGNELILNLLFLYCLGLHPLSFANVLLKVRIEEKPVEYAISVIGKFELFRRLQARVILLIFRYSLKDVLNLFLNICAICERLI